MKPMRFAEEQIIGNLAGAGSRGKDGRCLPQYRISSGTSYNWKTK